MLRRINFSRQLRTTGATITTTANFAFVTKSQESRRFLSSSSTTKAATAEFDQFITTSEDSFIARKPELAADLRERRQQLSAMQSQYDNEVVRANKKVKILGLGMLTFLCLQWGVLFNWVFFVFDWNLVEPVTYFLGSSCAWFAIVWYSITGNDWTYSGWNESVAQRMAKKKLIRADPDFFTKFRELEEEVAEYHKMENSIYVALEGEKI